MSFHLQLDGSVVVEFGTASSAPPRARISVLVPEASEMPVTALLAIASLKLHEVFDAGVQVRLPSD